MGSVIHIQRFELTEVYTHPDAKVDIVLVHGLNGHPEYTWTAKNGTFWPSQLLPASLKSTQARILVYGYNADVSTFGSGKGGPSSDMIHQHAQSLLTTLASERKDEGLGRNPLIWVAHSLGGILVKRALELSNDLQGRNDDDLRSIYVSTYGIVFLGTPHTGSDAAAWGLILQGMVNALVPKKIMESHSQLIRTLQSNNETLQNINLKFLDIYPRFKVCMVHEAHPTDIKGTKTLIVNQLSASPLLPDVQYFGIEATHSGMCKFENKHSPGYTNIAVTLRSWVQECPPVVESFWEHETVSRMQKQEADIARLRGNYPRSPPQNVSSPNTSDLSVNRSAIMVNSTISTEPDTLGQDAPYFIRPSGFRPNSLFVGRTAELSELHKMLFDEKKRSEGTSAVLIQSLPGGGKTHLARQYVYAHKDDFPGGIFWLRAKSQTELAAAFWDIARKAALKHPVTPNADHSRDPELFIMMVRKWLNNRRDWLMVLDGVRFTDATAIRHFIPDSSNTSLIYTSTEKSVIGDHHFMNPQLIRLPLLSAREAQSLLLLELGRREPFAKDDLRNSMELVQSMGFLPVVIHAVAQRLKTTDEPLSKFARSYSSQPRLRDLGTYMAVVEQLRDHNYVEALNLIHILCFYSQHIPVEMISLGLPALDISVKALEPAIGRSLNNTFKILNTFALIERNDHDDVMSINASQSSGGSSRGSRDMLADNVDVIRLHSVVQGFFIDTLKAADALILWLDRAIRLFCCSYDAANKRITRRTNGGLVEDYRRYEIHGIRLLEHLEKHRSKCLSVDEMIIFEDATRELESRLSAIKGEIERRTPESSQIIVEGKSDTFYTSIFDRTSSSSDAGPETPGFHDKGLSAWGLDIGKPQHESPSSIRADGRSNSLETSGGSTVPIHLPMPEDFGYEHNSEKAHAITLQPSLQTVQQDPTTPHSSEGGWEEVHRQPMARHEQPLRPMKKMQKGIYSARSYRSMSGIAASVTHETALGYLHSTSSHSQPPGRLSGLSSAEAALGHIHKGSPPPPRGGGMLQDRRPSSGRPKIQGRMTTGAPSYAAAVAGATREKIEGWRDLIHQATQPPENPERSMSTSNTEQPRSSAVESLQRFPIEVALDQFTFPHPRNPTYTSIPPYPQTPAAHAVVEAEVFPFPTVYNQGNVATGPDPFPFYHYTGIPPTLQSAALSPPQRGHSKSFSAETPPSIFPLPLIDNPLSHSSPNILRATSSAHYPGRPELLNQQGSYIGGYISQPMSRGPSGQSADTVGKGNGRARNVADTEPIPSLPIFSTRIPPTSYQIYQRMREREEASRRNSAASLGPGKARKSPILEYAREALVERLDDWRAGVVDNGSAAGRRLSTFNPTAPSFSPASAHSAKLPSAPANSMFSSTSNISYASQSPYPSPIPAFNYNQTPNSFNTGSFLAPYVAPYPPANTPAEGGESMQRDGSAGSGGVRIGRRVIEFGDYPEPVEVGAARERLVLQSWNIRQYEAEEAQKRSNSNTKGLYHQHEEVFLMWLPMRGRKQTGVICSWWPCMHGVSWWFIYIPSA